MATIECCEFSSPIVLGDTVATIEIVAGTPDTVDDIIIYVEGCSDGSNNCSYQDTYEDLYCDVTSGGSFPNATVTDTIYEINQIPANHTLVIDAVERVITLKQTGTNNQVGGLEVLEFQGLFEWIASTGGGCVSVCIDGTEAHTNDGADPTTVKIETTDREL